MWEQSGASVLLSYGALSFAIVITLWGAERIADRLETLRATTSAEVDSSELFREVSSVGPLVAAAMTAIAFALSTLIADGWMPAILRGVTWFLLAIAFWTFLWTYASLYLGLDRLGRRHLPSDAGRVDPTLGLSPLGSAAFMGLWMLLAWLVPVLLTSLPDVLGVAIGVLVLGGALATFFSPCFVSTARWSK